MLALHRRRLSGGLLQLRRQWRSGVDYKHCVFRPWNAHGDVMEKSRKKLLRSQFRRDVFTRDKHKCRCCGADGYDRQDEPVVGKVPLDAHHISNRDEMPNGGYVKENGISVCDDCHLKAEAFWSTGEAVEGFSPEELYLKIGSSFELAVQASIIDLGKFC